MTQDEILFDCEERMDKATTVLHGQLQGIRTGRATPGLVDSIRVDYYGSMTPLKQIASVSCPEPQQIVVRPYDATQISAMVKAIQASDVGLTPNSDGRLIRLNVPSLSTERRRQLVGRVKELAEDARIAIRNVRRDGNKHADQSQKDKKLTEDDCDAVKEQVQELTKQYEGKVNSMAEAKEKEVMDN
ncbi:MAG: ribosome recycling factor [Planctomycetales bacterium]|nr:ribosome recycling factor [Planctomycetales bacterium]